MPSAALAPPSFVKRSSRTLCAGAMSSKLGSFVSTVIGLSPSLSTSPKSSVCPPVSVSAMWPGITTSKCGPSEMPLPVGRALARGEDRARELRHHVREVEAQVADVRHGRRPVRVPLRVAAEPRVGEEHGHFRARPVLRVAVLHVEAESRELHFKPE